MDQQYLLELFRLGDPTAFKTVYNSLSQPLLYFAQNLINDWTVSEDIVANAFSKLHKRKEKMQSLDHIRRSLFICVKNECIDEFRNRKRYLKFKEGNEYLDDEVETKNLAELEMIKTMILDKLNNALVSLPNRRRTIINMYFFQSKSTGEIAHELHLDTQTVLNHKTRALDALRKHFPNKNYTYI